MKFVSFVFILLLNILSCSLFQSVKKFEIPAEKKWNQVRIKIDLSQTETEIRTTGKYNILENNKILQKSEKTFTPNSELPSLGNSIILDFNDQKFTYKGRDYRGSLELKRKKEGLQVINLINLEEYLYSVVPSEMPASWPMEALKAQAIAARTYAVFNILNPKFDEYHMEADIKSQMYSGMMRENIHSTKAVVDTKGLVLTFSDQLIQAFYHSNSGGKTETPDMVWGMKLAYLESVNSEFCKQTEMHKWKVKIPITEISDKFKHLGLGTIESITVAETTPSGRAKTIEIKGSERTTTIRGQDFRMSLGPMKLKSLLFDLSKEEADYIFDGKGFGHGVGMSQWGSHYMALNKFQSEDILKYYYKNTEILQLDLK